MSQNLETPPDLLEVGAQVIKQRKLSDISLELDCSTDFVRLILNGTRPFDPTNKQHWAMYKLAKQIYTKFDAILNGNAPFIRA